MEQINLLTNLEKISSKFSNRLLKMEGYMLKDNNQEDLEIIIFKGFSSSTTHSIEFDLEKKFIDFDHFFTNSKLYKAPLNKNSDDFIRQNQNPFFFLNEKNWN